MPWKIIFSGEIPEKMLLPSISPVLKVEEATPYYDGLNPTKS
jgi:hypothetical protein